MSDNYKSARPWHRFRRMVERRGSRVDLTVEERRLFYESVDSHLGGSLLKSEMQACGVRLYVLYREIEEQLGRDGRVESFALVLCESPSQVYNWIRGANGVKRYTVDLLHSWCVLLTRHWESDGIVVHLLCHPTGVLEPLVSGIGDGSVLSCPYRPPSSP